MDVGGVDVSVSSPLGSSMIATEISLAIGNGLLAHDRQYRRSRSQIIGHSSVNPHRTRYKVMHVRLTGVQVKCIAACHSPTQELMYSTLMILDFLSEDTGLGMEFLESHVRCEGEKRQAITKDVVLKAEKNVRVFFTLTDENFELILVEQSRSLAASTARMHCWLTTLLWRRVQA